MSEASLWDSLTSECVQRVRKQLICHVRTLADNTTRDVCQLRSDEDEDDPETMHAIFISVVIVSVFLSVTLNFVVILVIWVNKRLYTLVNYLTSLLCLNNIFWILFPIVESLKGHIEPRIHCVTRFYIIQITRSVNFGIIVTITLLRYLIVVRNHSYPAVRKNILLFTFIAVLPCIIRFMTKKLEETGECAPVLAWTPEHWPIKRVVTREKRFETFIGLLLEYLLGFAVIGFSHVNILLKSLRSQKDIKRHVENSKRAAPLGTIMLQDQSNSSRSRTPRYLSSTPEPDTSDQNKMRVQATASKSSSTTDPATSGSNTLRVSAGTKYFGRLQCAGKDEPAEVRSSETEDDAASLGSPTLASESSPRPAASLANGAMGDRQPRARTP